MNAWNKVLVIAAHPDDELLGCGATVARFASQGAHVSFCILGEGLTSRNQKTSADDLDQLKVTALKAASVVGVKQVIFKSLPDNRFDSVSLLDVVQSVEEVLKDQKPDLVLTHSGADLNIDHRITFEAVLTATRPVNPHSVQAIWSFETPSATDWSFGALHGSFKPTIFVDVTGFIDKKLAALSCYQSEMRAFPHPRSPEVIAAMATRYGSLIHVQAAEAFELVRSLIK